MFGWLRRKKVDKDAALRASMMKTLESYDASKDDTPTTFTEIDFGHGNVRIKKVTIKAGIDMDPWAKSDPKETARWIKGKQNK